MRGLIIGIDGFEDAEMFVPRDLLIRYGYIMDITSFSNDLKLKSKCGISLSANINIKDVDIKGYDFLLIPGGSVDIIKDENKDKLEFVLDIISKFNKDGKLICAICAAPYLLYLSNLLEDNKFTCYPGIENMINLKSNKEKVFTNKNIITSNGMANSFLFGYEIIKYYVGDEKMLGFKKVLYDEN